MNDELFDAMKNDLAVLDMLVGHVIQNLDRMDVLNIMDIADQIEDTDFSGLTGDPDSVERYKATCHKVVQRLRVLAGS